MEWKYVTGSMAMKLYKQMELTDHKFIFEEKNT